VNFPAVHSLATRWTLESERARAISLHFSGVAAGTIVAQLLTPQIVLAAGWPSVFYLSGALGAVWLVAWWLKAANDPESCIGVRAAEMAVIPSGRPESPLAESIPWGRILHEKAVWAIVIAHLCNNFGFYILLLWLPSYLNNTFAVPMARLGKLSVIPYVAAFIMQNSSGWIADTLRRRGVPLTIVRKSLQSAAFMVGALPLLVLPMAGSAAVAVTLVTIALAGTGRGYPDGLVEYVRDDSRNRRRGGHRLHPADDPFVFGGLLPDDGHLSHRAGLLPRARQRRAQNLAKAARTRATLIFALSKVPRRW
jgi:sugar phosphate permease